MRCNKELLTYLLTYLLTICFLYSGCAVYDLWYYISSQLQYDWSRCGFDVIIYPWRFYECETNSIWLDVSDRHDAVSVHRVGLLQDHVTTNSIYCNKAVPCIYNREVSRRVLDTEMNETGEIREWLSAAIYTRDGEGDEDGNAEGGWEKGWRRCTGDIHGSAGRKSMAKERAVTAKYFRFYW